MTENIKNLLKQNESFVEARLVTLNTSPSLLKFLKEDGQHPTTCIITCSDSRVIPELIFYSTFGNIFTIRTAGNTISESTLGSVEYALEHLHIKDVVVLGHTYCGAVDAAMSGNVEGFSKFITDSIKLCIGDEQDKIAATKLNAISQAKTLKSHFTNANIYAAVYDIETGKVSILKEFEA